MLLLLLTICLLISIIYMMHVALVSRKKSNHMLLFYNHLNCAVVNLKAVVAKRYPSYRELPGVLGFPRLLSAPPADLPRLCCLRAMEARCISAPVSGRAPFLGVRVMVCWGGAQMAAAASRFNKVFPTSVPYWRRRREACGSGVVSRISSGGGVLRIVKELHRWFFLLLRLRDGCGLLDLFDDFPSAINNVRPT